MKLRRKIFSCLSKISGVSHYILSWLAVFSAPVWAWVFALSFTALSWFYLLSGDTVTGTVYGVASIPFTVSVILLSNIWLLLGAVGLYLFSGLTGILSETKKRRITVEFPLRRASYKRPVYT